MTGDLPEGVDTATLMEHVTNLEATGILLNAVGAYLGAESGTTDEAAKEMALDIIIRDCVERPDLAGGIILALASIIVGTAPQHDVQAWFEDQVGHIKDALDG